MDNKNNITINGAGSYCGGEYNCVVINGGGKFSSDLKCNILEVNGGGKIDGEVDAEKFVVNGSLKCKKAAGESLRVNGNVSVEGDININNVEIYGLVSSKGDTNGKKIEVYGKLSVEKNVNASDLNIRGKLTANEVSADKINVDGTIIVQSLFGDEIVMKKKMQANKLFSMFSSFVRYDDNSKIDLIECTKLSADNLEAKIVRATDVEIGDKCIIDLVEYSGSINISPNARVSKYVKI